MNRDRGRFGVFACSMVLAVFSTQRLLDALARAGATTDTADVMILHPRDSFTGSPTLPDQRDAEVVTVNLREIQDGKLSRDVTIRDGDTIFVTKAERFFVVGLVRNAGSYLAQTDQHLVYLDLQSGHPFQDVPLPMDVIYVLLVSNTYGNYLLDETMRAGEFDLLSRIVPERACPSCNLSRGHRPSSRVLSAAH